MPTVAELFYYKYLMSTQAKLMAVPVGSLLQEFLESPLLYKFLECADPSSSVKKITYCMAGVSLLRCYCFDNEEIPHSWWY